MVAWSGRVLSTLAKSFSVYISVWLLTNLQESSYIFNCDKRKAREKVKRERTHLLTALTEPAIASPPLSPESYNTPVISSKTPWTLLRSHRGLSRGFSPAAAIAITRTIIEVRQVVGGGRKTTTNDRKPSKNSSAHENEPILREQAIARKYPLTAIGRSVSRPFHACGAQGLVFDCKNTVL